MHTERTTSYSIIYYIESTLTFWSIKYSFMQKLLVIYRSLIFFSFQNSPDCHQHTWGHPSGSSLYGHGTGSSLGSECSWRPDGDGEYRCRRRGGLATSCQGKPQYQAPCWQVRMQSAPPGLLKRENLQIWTSTACTLFHTNAAVQSYFLILHTK